MSPFVLVVVFLVGALVFSAIKILKEYERGVMFTLGRFTGVKGPGIILVIPILQQMTKVDLRVIVLDVPKQDVISRDNVSVKVNAVVYFRVVDPGQSHHPGRQSVGGHQPVRADDAALGAGPARPRRNAVATR